MDESSPSVRRKSNKRRSTVLTSDDEVDHPLPPPHKRARHRESYDPYDEEPLVDVDDSNEATSSRSRSPPSRRLSHKKRGGNTASTKVHPAKTRRRMDDSEDESDDVPADDFLDDEDDFVEVEEELPKKGKSKPAPKGKGKPAKGTKNSKAKGKVDSQEKVIVVRDERQGLGGDAASATKVRIKPSLSLDATPAAESGADSSVPDADKNDILPPQNKRKLPTIKKNKPQTSGLPATPVAAGPAPKTTTTDGIPAIPAASGPRVPAAAQGADFNLQDRGVYDMLFKNASGGSSRSGSRRETEERRKVLDNLREADKARRALEAKHTFDLQAQMDKISVFEERLKRARSSVLFPNILGAKMRDVYELEKKRQEPQEEGEELELPS